MSPRHLLTVTISAGLLVAGCGDLVQKVTNPDPHKGEQEAMERMVADSQARQSQEGEARKAAIQKSEEERATKKRTEEEDKDAKRREKDRELEQSCAASRPERLADLKEKVKDFHAELKKIGPHLKWIEAHCKYEDTRGTLVQRERTKDGVVIRTKQVGQERDVKCDAPKPAGITQDMADRATYFNSLEEGDPVGLYYSSDRNRFGQENSRCAPADKAAGIDLFVKMTDIEGQKAILAK